MSNRPGAAKRKATRNAITATGHFLSWVIEFLILGEKSTTLQGDHPARLYFVDFYLGSYTMLPACQTNLVRFAEGKIVHQSNQSRQHVVADLT